MINKKLLKPIQNKGATKPDTSAKAHDTLLNRDAAGQHPIAAITDLQTKLDRLALKQNKLTAGANITITGDTISATGGSTGNFVTLDTDQTITGEKTFTKTITINNDGKKYSFHTNTIGGLNFSAPNYIRNTVGGKNIIGFYDNGDIRCFNNRITEVRTPTADYDAATKKYVDDAVAAALRPYLIDLKNRKES